MDSREELLYLEIGVVVQGVRYSNEISANEGEPAQAVGRAVTSDG